MMERPLIPLVFALAGGIALGNYIYIPDLIAVLGLCATFLIFPLSFFTKKYTAAALALLISLFAIGILHVNLYLYSKPDENDIFHHADGELVSVEGLICENPHVRYDKTDYIISTRRLFKNDCAIPVHGTILLSVKGIKHQYNYGNVIRAKTRLRKLCFQTIY